MATPPRYLPPAGTVMVTRRILRRQLRLRPEESINELLLYMLVVAAEKYGIKIHCFQFLSNHFLCSAEHKKCYGQRPVMCSETVSSALSG